MSGPLEATDTVPLVLSQDYELFFQDSGTIEDCLLRPSDWLSAFARERGASLTFFVDAGMLSRMSALRNQPTVGRMYDTVRRHVAQLANAGHEIGLHVHPHWEDTEWDGTRWQFGGARYRLDQFSVEETQDIVTRYAAELQALTDRRLLTYRAGGFCIEPFDHLREALLSLDITVDSSVVPGAYLQDAEKGFDFRAVPEAPWWYFDASPRKADPAGRFLEIPISTTTLPFFHYWKRLFARLAGKGGGGAAAGGAPKRLGALAIVRRLLGDGRISELSVDAPKAPQLVAAAAADRVPPFWQVMGHPKLVTPESLQYLGRFLDARGIRRVIPLASLAEDIGNGTIQKPEQRRAA
ncbi:MAG: hypothetical protein AAGF46_03590 [Pseudomonadota bacterium]